MARERREVAYGPTFVFGEYIARGDLVALLATYRASEPVIQAVYPSARYVPLKVRQFIDHLVDTFGDHPPCDGMRSSSKQQAVS